MVAIDFGPMSTFGPKSVNTLLYTKYMMIVTPTSLITNYYNETEMW